MRLVAPLIARSIPRPRAGTFPASSTSRLRACDFAAGSLRTSARLQPSADRKHLASACRQEEARIRGGVRGMGHHSMNLDRVGGKRPSIVFPGGGIYFWWQAGALKALQETCDLDEYEFAGASAGSLSAVFAACNVDMDEVYRSAHRLASENGIWERREGLAGVWGSLIQTWLEEILPEDAALRCSGRVSISVTELRPWLMPFRRCQVCNSSDGDFVSLACMPICTARTHYLSYSARGRVILVTERFATDIGIHDERGRHPGLLGAAARGGGSIHLYIHL
jgi:hypothetical protein